MLEGSSGREGNVNETAWKVIEKEKQQGVLDMTLTGPHLTEEWGLTTVPQRSSVPTNTKSLTCFQGLHRADTSSSLQTVSQTERV